MTALILALLLPGGAWLAMHMVAERRRNAELIAAIDRVAISAQAVIDAWAEDARAALADDHPRAPGTF